MLSLLVSGFGCLFLFTKSLSFLLGHDPLLFLGLDILALASLVNALVRDLDCNEAHDSQRHQINQRAYRFTTQCSIKSRSVLRYHKTEVGKLTFCCRALRFGSLTSPKRGDVTLSTHRNKIRRMP